MPTTRSKRNEDGAGSSEENVTIEEDSSRTPTTEETTTTETTAPLPETSQKTVPTTEACKKPSKALRIARAKEELINLQVKLAAARLETIELEKDEEQAATAQNPDERIAQWLTETDSADTLKNPPAETHLTEAKKIEKDGRIDISELATAIAIAARSGPQSTRPIDLPQYGGSHHDWLCFKAAFDETQKLFTENENIARLRRALIGRAREAVENLLLYNAKTEDVMNTLKIRFGRPDSIALVEMERLRALPRLTDNPKDICIFASRVANTVATLRALNKQHYLFNPEAIKVTIEKLTPSLRYRWYDFATEQQQEDPDLEKLAAFLNRESERCSRYAQPDTLHEPAPQIATRRHKTYNSIEKIDNRNRCVVCTGDHDTIECKKFTQATVQERWDIAKEKKLCYSCLRYRTRMHRCKRVRCDIDQCQYWHHKLLHYKKIEQKTEETVASTWATHGCTSYLKIVPIHVTGPSGSVDTHALLDDGSTITLIDEEIANKTGATGPIESLNIEAIGDHKLSATSRRVNITIIGGSNRKYDVHARTLKNLKLSPQVITERDLHDCSHLKDIKKYLQYREAKPRVLIGQDNWHLLIASEIRKGRRHQPIASRTPLGWVLHGARSIAHSTTKQRFNVNYVKSTDEEMNEQLRQFFALESLLIEGKRPSTDPDVRALRTLDEGVIEKQGKYEVPLLWKNAEIKLPDNYHNTLKRLVNIEKKLDRDPALKIKYTEQMEALIEKGYAERAPSEKIEARTWYLPHFAVFNPTKPAKIRIVHDAAAKTKGLSLNDHLLKGPDLIQSLPGVLMRFRQRNIAITADIKEMFMQIKIKNEDRDALRYLWRGDRRDNTAPDEYRMTSLIFGATCSPAIAIYIKNRNAAKYIESDPEAYDAIVRNHYVDDLLNSYDTEDEAINSARRISEIHKEASYELRQWTSNSRNVLNALAPGTTRSSISLDGSSNVERTLGVIWDPASDEIGFNLSLARLPPDAIENSQPTKRETLRILMSLFDPLGLASPVTIGAKRILQHIWRRGTGWDERIPQDLAEQWTKWITHLIELKDVKIPRAYLHYSNATSLQLHIFVDASEEAYAAIAYWRASTTTGVDISLVAAKAKVCPLKTYVYT
ncbi:uncharacterized protein LOC123694549 [Colias croceus]|uniref:uncharacterized protein LOC123694549 n=1 Tax=Colias crocea TaxID=72248 RepID=UPI001E27C5A3|nr:uncharacterized protein LOC123694549 [Colias croceus]